MNSNKIVRVGLELWDNLSINLLYLPERAAPRSHSSYVCSFGSCSSVPADVRR